MRAWVGLSVVAMLAGCGRAPEDGTQAEPAAAGSFDQAQADMDGAIKVAAPQIAYIYRYGFRVPSERLAAVQDAHVAACDRLGQTRCQVIAMVRSADEAGGDATLSLAVDARLARAFGRALIGIVSDGHGSQSSQAIEAEDLSKQIVDTEARLRSRQALADRLMDLLRTRKGPVADLVAAEKGVADVQEEIDAARSWLAEARGRVAMSKVEIGYDGGGAIAGGFWSEVRAPFRTLGATAGKSVGIVLMLLAVLAPWVAIVGLIVWLVRRARQRRSMAE